MLYNVESGVKNSFDHRSLQQRCGQPGAPTANGFTSSPTGRCNPRSAALGARVCRILTSTAPTRSTRLPLKKGLVSPFQPADELHPKSDPPSPAGKPADEAGDKKSADSPQDGRAKVEKIDIDLDGIAARIQEVPVPPGNYQDLQLADRRTLLDQCRSRTIRKKQRCECIDIANKGDKPEDAAGRRARLRNLGRRQEDAWSTDRTTCLLLDVLASRPMR